MPTIGVNATDKQCHICRGMAFVTSVCSITYTSTGFSYILYIYVPPLVGFDREIAFGTII